MTAPNGSNIFPNLSLINTPQSAEFTLDNLNQLLELLNAQVAPIANPIFQGHLSYSTGIVVATGTNQATAALITADTVIISSTGAGQGAIMPANTGANIFLYNASANSVLIYPPVGASFNGGTTNAPVTLGAGNTGIFDAFTSSAWVASLPSGLVSAYGYNTNSATASTTLTAANVIGPYGFVEATLNLNGTLTGAATATLPSVAAVIAAITNGSPGQQWKLRIMNNSAGAFTWTVAAGTGWTLNGTMTVPQNTTRDFYVTLNTATTATLQDIGSAVAP